MHGNNIRACRDEIIQVLIRVGNHQVYVEHRVRRLAQRLDNRRADGNIWDKMPVHHVHMDIFRARVYCGSDVTGEVREIRR